MTGSKVKGLRDEIRSALMEAGLAKVDNDTLSKCLSLAKTLHATPKQMSECWEAFSLNRNLTKLDDHSFPSYRLALIKESGNAVIEEETHSRVHTPGAAVVSRGTKHQSPTTDGDDDLSSVTPPAKRLQVTFDGSVNTAPRPSTIGSSGASRRVSLSPAPPGSLMSSRSNLPKYNERSDAGKVVTTFDPNNLVEKLPPADSLASDSPKCSISYSFPSNVQEPYRHLFTTLDDRARALDRHLVEMGEHIVERYGLGKEEDETGDVAGLEAVGVPRQEKICCIGRVCNSAHEGRINATSILLEGSRHMSGAARVELDLSHLTSNKVPYSLFPGQIVAVEGMNTSGRKMVAQRICEGAAHPANKSTIKELLKYHHHDEFQGGRPLQIIAVSGPFTTSDNLDYEPLLDLMNRIQAEKPDVVILTGPFVDMRHKAVSSGQTTLQFQDGEETLVSFEAFFANKIAGLLEDLFSSAEGVHTQFVLVPSLDDATAAWVYPQPPMTDSVPGGKDVNIPGAEGIEVGSLGLVHVETAGSDEGSKKSRRVHCVSNPCTLRINEVVIGVSSTDALFHISTDEANANLEPGSRLARISQHMLQQRSYYPLFPAAAGTNLDLKRMQQWAMPALPDLLIVPSRLTSFARTVLDKSTVVVNPGRLVRDTTGGTYARMQVFPIERESLENAGSDDVEVPHGIAERSRVEILRI